MNCHSAHVRPFDRGLGPSSTAESYAQETGAIMGSSRTGPDIQNLAGRDASQVLKTRLTNPSALQPGTLMPSYSYLDEPRLSALIAYLGRFGGLAGAFERVREVNGIEPAVPDAVLRSLSKYLNVDTGALLLPLEDNPRAETVARGIYNSRCSACHGTEAREDMMLSPEDASGTIPGTVPPVPPADFSDPKFDTYSAVMWYWRITDGVPGTRMPAWGGALSEQAVWLLVSYLLRTAEAETESTVLGKEIRVPSSEVGGPFGPEAWDLSWTQFLEPAQVSTGADEAVFSGMLEEENTTESNKAESDQ